MGCKPCKTSQKEEFVVTQETSTKKDGKSGKKANKKSPSVWKEKVFEFDDLKAKQDTEESKDITEERKSDTAVSRKNSKKSSGKSPSVKKKKKQTSKSKKAFVEEPDILDHFPVPSQVSIVDYIPKKEVAYIRVEDTFWSKKKKLIPDYSVMEKIDNHAVNAKDSLRTTPKELVSYLLKPCKTEVEKVRALTRWIGENIAYDVVGRDNPSVCDSTVEGVLKNKRAVCEGYSNVVQMFCQLANIEAEKISGQTKNGTNPKPDIRKVPKSDHAWNRVKIRGSWYFVDSTWCAGSVGENVFKKQWNEWWFLPDPEAFVFSHLPVASDDTILTDLQMVKKPRYSSEEWDINIERTPAMCTFGIEPITYAKIRIMTKESEITIQYTCKANLAHFVNLYFEKKNMTKKMDPSSTILYETEGTMNCRIRFHAPGVYIAKIVSEVKNGHHMITQPITSLIYRITYDGDGVTSFPEVLHNTLGLHKDFEMSGFRLISPKSPVVSTSNGCAIITIKLPTKGVVSNLFRFYKSESKKNNVLGSGELNGLVYGEKKGDIARYFVQCPEKGDYKLGIFAKCEQGDSLQLAMSFLITCTDTKPSVFHHPEANNLSNQLAGPNAHFYDVGLTTDQNSSTLNYVDDVVTLCIKKTKPARVLVQLHSSCDVNKEELFRKEDNDDHVKVIINKPNIQGYYWFSIYAKKGVEGGSMSYAGSFCIAYKIPAHGR